MATFPAFVPANFQGDVTLDHLIPATEARFAPLPDDLRHDLARALPSRVVDRLYSRQSDSYNTAPIAAYSLVVPAR